MMTVRTRVAVVLALITLYTAYSVNQEIVPTSTSNPFILKFLSWLFRNIGTLGATLDSFGIAKEYNVVRTIVDHWNLLSFPYRQGVLTEDTEFNGIPVRVYRPEDSSGVLPGMMYYHGGGWVIGSMDSHDQIATYFSKEAHVVVMSVNYRMRPEFTQMDGLQDCLTATKHFIREATKYSVDPKRIGISGDSAGANYAAVIAMLLRNEKFQPMPKIQLLIYPVTQAIDLFLPSYQQNARGPMMTRDNMLWFLSYVYFANSSMMTVLDQNAHVPISVRKDMGKTLLNHDLLPKEMLYPPYKSHTLKEGNNNIWELVKDKVLDWRHYPLMAEDLSNLPEAYVFTAQYDVLRDEGYLYAQRLKDAGVKVTYYNCPFCWHAVVNSVYQIKDSRIVMNQIVSYIKEHI